MSYAFSTSQRDSTAATLQIPMVVDATEPTQPANLPDDPMDTDEMDARNLSQPHPQLQFQRRPVVRQLCPNPPAEIAFDRNNLSELAIAALTSGQISFRRRDGQLLAFEAAASGNIGALRILLGRGDSTEHTNAAGQTVLIIAAANGQTDTVRAIAPYLPNIEHQDHQGNTALIYACQQGNAPMVELLLQMGADPATRNNINRSAVDIARDNGHIAILRKMRNNIRL